MCFNRTKGKMIRKTLIYSLLIMAAPAWAQDAKTYIQNYKEIAVAEMLRTGIPASIKLAQGMVESNCGTSELACKANNHFGIKCGGDWSGKSFHKEDDDYKDGELTKSCFREFKTPFDSYVAHSDFLTDPKKSNRYGFLFELKPTDYQDWAKGLSKAGYATDPAYANKLIRIIEENQLYLLDEGQDMNVAAVKPKSSLGYTLVRYNNDIKYVVASGDETIAAIASKYDIGENQLIRYNDQAYNTEQLIAKGSKVYLQPKRSSFHGKQKYYQLKKGQDLLFIAQEFGVKLSALQKRNGIEGNQVPVSGQKIFLKGKSKTPLKTVDPYKAPEAPKVEPVIETHVTATPKPVSQPVQKAVVPEKPMVQIDTATADSNSSSLLINEHTVAKGETLYSISRNCGVPVDELKKRNNLEVDTIFVGQKLILK